MMPVASEYFPHECRVMSRPLLASQVAILIPFRNRHEHLPILLRHLVPVLQSQRLQFAFYLIEQVRTCPCRGATKQIEFGVFVVLICFTLKMQNNYMTGCQRILSPGGHRVVQPSHAVQCGLQGGHERPGLGLSDLPRRGSPHGE